MRGKIIVITGGTSGIGQIAAERLAGLGARIVLVARDEARGESTLNRLRSANGAVDHCAHYGDLSKVSEAKRLAADISASEQRIDVLMNNAGAMFGSRQVTSDNLELTFATNHMAYFVFTLGLSERLFVSSPARVVNTASAAHKGSTLDFDDLQSSRNYSGFRVYGRSKLCNVLFTRELARRWNAKGVTANCLHPGFVATRFGDRSGGLLSLGTRIAKLFAISPEKGAETLVYLATSPEVASTTGEYFYQCRPARLSAQACDAASGERLWMDSERLAGIRP